MTSKRKATGGKRAGKLKVKKETIKDLDSQRKGKNVKGGLAVRPTELATCAITCTCITCLLCPMAK